MATYKSHLFKASLALTIVGLLLAACGGAATPAATSAPAISAMDKLVADAKAEGTLTTIALPHD
ncbi:MAG: ABC transporter substrate-binding protein, partial [Chloroflexi bacterium]|nr:ABC transporter substrate-binding protein [Chloroflexota bacterium]